MASIPERSRAGKPAKFQVAIRLTGLPPVYKTFQNQADAEAFVARVEPELQKRRREGIAKLEKESKKKRPVHVDFYGQKLRDVILAFGALEPVEEDASAASPAKSKTSQRLTSAARKARPGETLRATGPASIRCSSMWAK